MMPACRRFLIPFFLGLVSTLGACGGGSSHVGTTDAGTDGGAGHDGGSGDAVEEAAVETGDSPGEATHVPSCMTAGSMLVNCSFERPPVVGNGFQNFNTGQSLDGWTVTGEGSVSTVSRNFQQDGFTFPAHDGAQALNLTGFTSNSATGVSQTVTTTVGAHYTLTFWVGNLFDSNGIFGRGTNAAGGTSSTVLVFVDGTQMGSAFNADLGFTMLNWQTFTFLFTAAAATTTIELRNDDSVHDSSNFIDDVTLLLAD
ncbi:MAG TPA: DUF642 domain-containing protein [Gemmatimonadaceae bacterium]|nr:DUF642 domain-containing protein [Gemmatimonadaceae bacterium]